MKFSAIAASVLTLFAPIALADIKYTIEGDPTVYDLVTSSYTINVGSIPDNASRLVHVYDDSGVDESVTNQITIQGSAGTNSVLKIQIAHSSEGDVFASPRTTRTFIDFGLRDFAGLSFGSNSALRDRSIVAVAIQGDITGDIDAAQIWRIDAIADENLTFGGHIKGKITAHKPDGSVMTGFSSIGYVRAYVGIGPHVDAGNGATADIVALGQQDELFRISARASIDRVIVGPVVVEADPLPPDVGLQGSVIALDGSIGSIFTTGPIGQPQMNPGTAPRIWAGRD